MKPEEITERIKAACGPALRSVVLYGSAAAGDHAGRRSDFNLLVVLGKLGVVELNALAPVVRPWLRAGNPPPLLFTEQGLRRSVDIFPIEFADMQASRRVLHGEDLVQALAVDPVDLRRQLERELKAKLIQLRQGYLLTERRRARTVGLMLESLTGILVLFRASLRLYGVDVPARKADALDALAGHISFDREVFHRLLAVKEGRAPARELDAEAVFGDYLAAVEAVVTAVDERLQQQG